MLKRKIFLISLLALFLISCFGCKEIQTPFVPVIDPDDPIVQPDKDVTVIVEYQRVDDNPDCPIIHPDDPFYDRALLKGSISELGYPENMMEKTGDDLFSKIVTDVEVNYPLSKYKDSYPYTVYIIDGVFYNNADDQEQDLRAHLLWMNGKLMENIRSGWKREYILVRVDANAVVHEVDE